MTYCKKDEILNSCAAARAEVTHRPQSPRECTKSTYIPLLIIQSHYRFHFLAEVLAKNVNQSMAAQGFLAKETLRKTSCFVIGAAYTITRH